MQLFKLSHLLVPFAALALTGCEPKTTGGKVKDTVDDALDRRPGEKVRDAAEDTRDAVKDAVKDIKGAVKDATK